MTWGGWEKSGKLAAYINRCCNTKKPVVVYGHKDPYMLVAFLACVRLGRAYCPIDTSVPLNRVQAIINEVQPEMILSTEKLVLETDGIVSKEDMLSILETENNSINKCEQVDSKDVFYIIFTSGSTGTPKGVQTTRECLDNFIKWALALGTGFEEGKQYFF